MHGINDDGVVISEGQWLPHPKWKFKAGSENLVYSIEGPHQNR